jgi:hypothetical protein
MPQCTPTHGGTSGTYKGKWEGTKEGREGEREGKAKLPNSSLLKDSLGEAKTCTSLYVATDTAITPKPG